MQTEEREYSANASGGMKPHVQNVIQRNCSAVSRADGGKNVQ